MPPHLPQEMWMWVRGMRISKGDDTSPIGNNNISGKRCRVSNEICGTSWGRFARISKFRDMWHYSSRVSFLNHHWLYWKSVSHILYYLLCDTWPWFVHYTIQFYCFSFTQVHTSYIKKKAKTQIKMILFNSMTLYLNCVIYFDLWW